jgi:type VI secretion system VasD/TssJ family lipoprotein
MRRIPLLVCVFALLLAGCATRTAHFRGVSPLNRNAEGESTPVDVRFFLLRDDDAFARTGFAALWTDPAGSLGHELIGKPAVATVLPGSVTDPAASVDLPGDEAAWIGVQLLVRREGELPRTLLIPIDRLSSCVVEVTGYGLRLADRR